MDGVDDGLKGTGVFEAVPAADLLLHVGLHHHHVLHLLLDLEVLQFFAQGQLDGLQLPH